MKKQQAVAIAAALFPNYPTVAAFHITTDGQAFELEHNAENHAKSLVKDTKDEPSWITVKAEDMEASENETLELSPLEKGAKLEELKKKLAEASEHLAQRQQELTDAKPGKPQEKAQKAVNVAQGVVDATKAEIDGLQASLSEEGASEVK